MGTRPRPKPEHLPAKVRAIRQHLGLSQLKLARQVLKMRVSGSRISEYESGTREPSLMVLLRYSEIVNVHMETIVSDQIDLEQFLFELEQ